MAYKPFVIGARRTLIVPLIIALTGCSGLVPRLQDAAITAAKDPWTWAPLVGAGVIAVTDNDERISDWAKSHTPLYGSNEDASEASDDFRAASDASAWLTLAGARKRGEGHWLREKSIDAAGGYVGVMAARNLTGYLKGAVGRARPHDGPTHDSFPSAHATDAFANATMARYYADGLPLPAKLRNGVKWTSTAFAAATAWARVEGGVHYPTDVLVGAAIASFSTNFFLRLTEPKDSDEWRFRPTTDGDAMIIEFERGF